MTELDNNLLITIPIKNLKYTKSRLGEILSLNQRIKITNFLLFQLISKINNLKKHFDRVINIALITSNKVKCCLWPFFL